MITPLTAIRVAVVGDHEQAACRSADWSRLGAGVRCHFFQHAFASIDAAVMALREFDVIIMVRERLALPHALLQRLPQLKLVIFSGRQHRFIDVKAATERGITVCAAPVSGGTSAAPELAWALLLACMRRVPEADAALRRGEWSLPLGRLLQGKTLGLLGLGQTGQRMARYANAFDMKVLAWSRSLRPENAAAHHVEAVDLSTVLAQSDILSLHLPLNEHTRGMLGAAELQQMKHGAVLINTARGALVDEHALIAALTQGRLAGAGLDVFEQEPLPVDHPLLALPQVVMTPHIGYVAEESLSAMYASMLEVLMRWLRGESVPPCPSS